MSQRERRKDGRGKSKYSRGPGKIREEGSREERRRESEKWVETSREENSVEKKIRIGARKDKKSMKEEKKRRENIKKYIEGKDLHINAENTYVRTCYFKVSKILMNLCKI